MFIDYCHLSANGQEGSKFLKEEETVPGTSTVSSSSVLGEKERESLFVRVSPPEKSFRLVEIINYSTARVSGHHNLYIRRQVTLQFNYLHVLNLQLYVINTNFEHFWAGPVNHITDFARGWMLDPIVS